MNTKIKGVGGIKSVVIVALFRLSQRMTQTRTRRIAGAPIRLLYRVFSRNIMHVEIWDTMKVGEGLKLWHGAHGSVINPNTVIGRNFSLRQNTTIGSGSFTDASLCPTIGDDVEVGPNVTILGKITIGDYAQIGGGSVVVNDVPPYAIVAGNPAKVIHMLPTLTWGGRSSLLHLLWQSDCGRIAA